MKWAGHGGEERCLKSFGRVTLGKKSSWKTREDDIKMDLREVGCGAWTGLNWLRMGTGCGLL
jgi:hypothetical protein